MLRNTEDGISMQAHVRHPRVHSRGLGSTKRAAMDEPVESLEGGNPRTPVSGKAPNADAGAETLPGAAPHGVAVHAGNNWGGRDAFFYAEKAADGASAGG